MQQQKEDTTAIARLRDEIDAVDEQIVRLLARRSCLAYEVGQAKGGTPVYRPERERQVIDRAVSLNDQLESHLSSNTLTTLYQEVIAACRAAEARPVVAYLGPAGTFTEMAVLARFGSAIEAVPCSSIDEVFRVAQTRNAGFAVVPIENSTEGAVTRTEDLLLTTDLTIIGEVSVKVEHNLMNKTGRREDIAQVCAHPQALAQCQLWLSTHLNGVHTHAADSNAAAAVLATENTSIAAIASKRAASLYDLKIVESAIQDNPRNTTRFLILGHEAPTNMSGVQMKTSLVLSTPNRAGALFALLEPFSRYGIQLCRLESRPAQNGAWEYNFYVDVEGHQHDATVHAALQEVGKIGSYVKILGSYPKEA